MRKPRIALVTGGYSSEAVISYKSAVTIQQNLDTGKYDVYRVDITPEAWFHPTADGQKIAINRQDFSLPLPGGVIHFDAIFIGIHGTPGEDGKLQGYFDLLGLPYTSCDAACSAITFNKRYTVAIAAFSGIKVARSLHLFSHSPLPAGEILKELKLPVFVKPNNGGSSIGMSKVNRADELPAALDKAFKEDSQVLVEEFIRGREFTIGVFRSGGETLTLPFTEVITHNEFFDYQAKYEGKSHEVTPAECTEEIAEQVRSTARKVYDVFNCRGIVRMDFIYEESVQQPYLLEINTVPGQSEASIVPQQVKAKGWELKQFYTMLVEEALSVRKSSIA
jgi:D-alanine-D-alanine ligase